MRESDYRRRVEADLRRWQASGWIDAEHLPTLLADVAKGRSAFSPVAWLSMIAASLAGLAVIALIAQNWGALKPGAKLIMLLGLFWLGVGLAFWAALRKKVSALNVASTFAVLVFAAAIGLIGQSFNMPGEMGDAAFGAALGAGVFAAASRAAGPGVVYFVACAVWFWETFSIGGRLDWRIEDLTLLALLVFGVWLGKLCDSRTLRHLAWLSAGMVSALLLGKLANTLPVDRAERDEVGFLLAFLMWTGFAVFGRIRMLAGKAGGRTVYGYGAWFALLAALGLGFSVGVPHRIVLLMLAVGVTVIGARDHHGWVTAAGLTSTVASCAWLLFDLGAPLWLASVIFAGGAMLSAFAAWLLFRSGRAAAPSPVAREKP